MDTVAAELRGSVTYLSTADLGMTANVSRSHRVATQTLRTLPPTTLASNRSSTPPSPSASSSVSPSLRGASLSSTSPCSGDFINNCYVYDDGREEICS
eukprot:10224956-Alexandrium_andersonii.AAC.1